MNVQYATRTKRACGGNVAAVLHTTRQNADGDKARAMRGKFYKFFEVGVCIGLFTTFLVFLSQRTHTPKFYDCHRRRLKR